MAGGRKLTEKTQPASVKENASFLITQLEGEEGSQKESVRRAGMNAMIAALRSFGILNGYSTTAQINAALAQLVANVEAVEGGIKVTFVNEEEVEIPIESGGLAFDGGYCAVNQEDGKTYLHLTADGVEIEDFDPIEIPAGGGGGPASGAIVLSNVVKAATVRNGADAIFSFNATSSDDTDVTVVWSVDGTQISSASGISGSGFSFNAKTYLRQSNSSVVKAEITSESGAALRRQWTVTSTAFSLAWSQAIHPIMLYTANEDVYVVVEVSAEAGTINIVTVAVGNHEVTQNVVGSRSITVALDKSWFSTGANEVTASMVNSLDETDTAEDITFTALWAYGAAAPVVAFAKSAFAGTQYDLALIPYFVYDPNNETATASIQVDDEAPRSVSAGREIQTFRYAPEEAGEYTLTLTCGASSETATLTAAASAYSIGKVTGDALQYNLDPTGHSNSDNDRTQFGGITFGAGFDWTNGGFQTDENGAPAFVVKKGCRATLPRSLFADADANGKTIDVSFRITNSDQYDAVALTDLNIGGTRGLILRANEGEIRLDNAAGQIIRACEQNRIDMSILVEGVTGQRVMTVWLDGIPSKVNPYTASMLVQSENACVIGSDHCDVWIYAIRVYNTALSMGDMIQNYISLGSTTAEKVARFLENDIYNQNGKITPASLHAAAPELTIIEIEAARMTTGKKDPVPADIRITDGNDVLELSRADGVNFKVQGTSSQAYARSALNMDIDFKGTGESYQISENSIPVSYLNIKVNVASSENANNACAVDWYNQFQPYLIEARQNNDAVRDTVESKPCAVFFKNTSSAAIWVSSQLVQPGDTILYVMGDLCNSKKNLEVFGEDGEGTHPTKACIEVSGNDTEAQRFRAESTYDAEEGEWITNGTTDYEWRMEPDDADLADVVDSWDDTVAWVVSTIGDSAKFKAEVGDYFAIQSLLYHYLYLEFFAAYDQVSKNTFYSYDWDATAQKYLWNITKCYDGDTILAFDNDGNPLGDYGLDYGDTIDGTVNGRSYFNAVTNTIWQNIKEAYQSELSALYISLRSAGAWNAQDIASKWDNYQAKRPHAAMAQDMYNKYIAPYKTTGVIINGSTYSYDDNYISRLAGSKTYQRRQFLTYQTDYMDGKYGYYSKSASMQFRTNGDSDTKDLTIKSYAKTYVTVIADDSVVDRQKVAAGGEAVFEDVSVGNNTTIYVTPDRLVQHVKPLNETKNSTFNASGAAKLAEAELGGEDENTAWQSGTGVNIPSPLLRKLSIRNMVNFSSALNLAQNVELHELDTRGTNAGLITLPAYAPLESIQLNVCTGIVATGLKQAETFSLASGQNLTSIRVEDCNSVINEAMLLYIQQAVAAGGNATRRVRMLDVDWQLNDIGLLHTLATKWKGYNALGEEQNAPVLTGTVSVYAWSQNKLDEVEAAFPDLTVTADPEGEVPTWAVRFLDWDGTVLKTETVNQGDAPTPPATDPSRANTPSTAYTFDGWSWTNGGTKIDDLDEVVIVQDSDFYARYTEATRSYRVRWYNGVTLIETQMVEYGGEAVYSGDTPVSPAEGDYATYYLFKGWDKSTGVVVQDIDVYAQYDSAAAPASGSLSDFTPEQLHALIGAEILSPSGTNNTLIASGDTIDIIAGNDYTFSNVESHEFISPDDPMDFDGATAYKPQIDGEDIALFDSDKSWVLAVDFAFDTACDTGGCLAACYDTNGFLLRYGGGGNVRYGTTAMQSASINGVRQITIIRKIAGDPKLHVYCSNKNGNNIVYNAMEQTTPPSHEAPLVFGASTDGEGYTDYYAKGTIYWAKLWMDDLGDTVCQDMAAWPRQTFKMQAVGSAEHAFRNFTRADNQRYVNCAFLLKDLLEETHVMNPSNSNAGGWKAMPMRTWLNNRLLKALPIKWRQMLLTVYVHSNTGYQATGNVDPPAEDKIWIPCCKEVGFNTTSGVYAVESDGTFTVFTNDASRVKKLKFGSGAAADWWLRSPHTGNTGNFYIVYSNGSSNNYGAYNANGVAFGFCI